MTYEELLSAGAEILAGEHVTDTRLDARYLLFYAFGMGETEYLMNRDRDILKSAGEEEKVRTRYDLFMQCIRKRADHIPLQYIIGTQEFMGLKFGVDESVLIPRQDTETLVEEVLTDLETKASRMSVLDVCTGSGCIAISLKKLGGFLEVSGLDVSEAALHRAEENAVALNVSVTWILSDLFKEVGNRKYDVIVANPPYIPAKVIKTLEPEVREHEPLLALDGAEDGLYFYRILSKESPKYLKNAGRIYFEIGFDQAEDVCSFLRENGFSEIQVIKDLPGKDRVVKAVLQETDKK